MNWKKVSEYPLPEGDGNKKFLVEYVSSFTGKKEMAILQHPTPLYKNNKPLYWTELELPPEEEIKKEPEIELWSVWENSGEIFIVFKIDSEFGVYGWYPDSLKTTSCHKDLFLTEFKPRPDLEVIAPYISKIVPYPFYVSFELSVSLLTKKEFDEDKLKLESHYKWPASLAQMIVVPKEKNGKEAMYE